MISNALEISVSIFCTDFIVAVLNDWQQIKKKEINFKIIIIHFQLARFIANPSFHVVANIKTKVLIIPQTQKSTSTVITTFISLIVFYTL